MQRILRRVEKLENGWNQASEAGEPLVVLLAGQELALDADRCVEILRESGFLARGPHISVIHLMDVPPDFNATELERFLRESGGELCTPPTAQSHRPKK
jgi:hypothetical protein